MDPTLDIKRLREIEIEIPKRLETVGKFIRTNPTKSLEEALKIINLQKEYNKITLYLFADIRKRQDVLDEEMERIKKKANEVLNDTTQKEST